MYETHSASENQSNPRKTQPKKTHTYPQADQEHDVETARQNEIF